MPAAIASAVVGTSVIVVQLVIGYDELPPNGQQEQHKVNVGARFARQHVADHEVLQTEQPDAEPEDGFAGRLLRGGVTHQRLNGRSPAAQDCPSVV